MSYISTRGEPLIIKGLFRDDFSFSDNELDFKQVYLKKGDNFKGLAIDNNIFINSKRELFNRYNLFENTEGINKLGVNRFANSVDITNEWVYIECLEPMFYGDYLYGYDKLGYCDYAEGEFVLERGLYVIRATFNDNLYIPNTLSDNNYLQANQWNLEVVNAFTLIKTEIEKLKNKAISNVSTTTGPIGNSGGTAVISVSTNSTDFNSTIDGIINTIDEEIKKLEELRL